MVCAPEKSPTASSVPGVDDTTGDLPVGHDDDVVDTAVVDDELPVEVLAGPDLQGSGECHRDLAFGDQRRSFDVGRAPEALRSVGLYRIGKAQKTDRQLDGVPVAVEELPGQSLLVGPEPDGHDRPTGAPSIEHARFRRTGHFRDLGAELLQSGRRECRPPDFESIWVADELSQRSLMSGQVSSEDGNDSYWVARPARLDPGLRMGRPVAEHGFHVCTEGTLLELDPIGHAHQSAAVRPRRLERRARMSVRWQAPEANATVATTPTPRL